MRLVSVGQALFAVCGVSMLGIGTFTGLGHPRSHDGPAEAGHYARLGERPDARPATLAERNGRQLQYWQGGHIRSDVTYLADAYDGEYRTWYESGAPYELRHYVNGHEEGLQQSWTDAGVVYLNYQVKSGRRFGLVNASPCNTVEGAEKTSARVTPPGDDATRLDGEPPGRPDSSGLPYYDEPTFSPQWVPVPHHVASFRLLTQTGSPLSNIALRGHPYVASFIYTQCAAICPLVVGQLSRVQDAVAGSDARIVSFSVTPDTDTPAALATFGRERNIDPRTWSLLTGSKRTIYTLARTSYFADDSRVGSSLDDETAFLHTEKLLLVDGDGRLRGVYNGTQPHAVDQLIDDLARLSVGR